MTEAQINRVALIIEVWFFAARMLDELGNPVHLFIVRRNQTFQTLRMIKQTRFRLLIYKGDNFGKHALRRIEKVGVIASAALVPIAECFPFASILAGTLNLALAGTNKIAIYPNPDVHHPASDQTSSPPVAYYAT